MDTLLKIISIMLIIAVVFALLGFVIGYNSPQMKSVFNQINTTQGYAVNMTNAFNDTNNYFNQNNTGFLAPIENVLAFIGNLLYKIGLLLYNFFALLFSIFVISFSLIFLVMPSILNMTSLGSLGNIASLIYDATIGILITTIAIYMINFVRGRNNV